MFIVRLDPRNPQPLDQKVDHTFSLNDVRSFDEDQLNALLQLIITELACRRAARLISETAADV